MATKPETTMAVDDTALKLGVTRFKVMTLLTTGKLTGRREGVRWRIDVASINRYLKAQ